MNRPGQMKEYPDIDLKLGIKSSLPNVKQTLALLILLWNSNDKPYEITYAITDGNGIVIDANLCERLLKYVEKILLDNNISNEEFCALINENQMCKSQLESLIVAFELIWKVAKIRFVDSSMPSSAERTGGKRYPKKLFFTVYMDLLGLLIDEHDEEYKKVLLKWLGLNISADSGKEGVLCNILTILSEEAVYKLADGENDIVFNQESVYEALGEKKVIDINGDKEAKGSLRILKSLLSDNLNPFLEYKGGTVKIQSGKEDFLDAYSRRVNTYLSLSTSRIAHSDEMPVEEESYIEQENEYQRAARILNEYILESGIVYEKTEDELASILDEFRRKFAPERLMELSDEDLLREMFYTAEQTNDSMCYWLEFQKDCRGQFGSVTGGTSLKFGLYQNKEGEWITGSPAKKEIISFDEAVQIGKSIRNKLTRGVEIIEGSTLDEVSDYEELHDKLVDALGNFATNNWVHKYFYMMFPDKLATWHSEDWQKHGLRALLINPSSKTYGRSGQIAIVAKYAGLMATHLGETFYEKFGGIKQFCRLGTSDHDGNYAEDWRKQHIAAIGWPAVGSLENYSQSNGYTGKDIVKKALAEKMQDEYYPDDAGIASRKAGELQTFYKTTKDSIFVMMDGEKLLALCDDVGNYTYNENNVHMPHNKSVIWHCCFDEEERLPKKAEGHMTSCVELKDDENLLYLYKKYYYELLKEGEEEMPEIKPETEEYIEPNYNTGFECDFERNRIVFGAPGTGKSYKLKQESEELLGCAENHMERVTFHTDYSYSQFVGSYKPVTDTVGNIRYDFVPGPFMRVYVNAVKNTQQIMKMYEAIEQADTMYMFPTNPNPSNEDEKWDLFEEITKVNQVETFHASKEAKVGDLALIYVANTKPGYKNGIYAIGKIVSRSEDIAAVRFDYVSYYWPIVDYETLKEFNPNIRSNGRVSDKIMELIKDTIIPANPYLLLIEEINRAKVAAVFGDVFQLLDRDDDGVSEYEIQTSEDVRKYLASQLGGVPEDWLKIKLPDNMFIWASMNSADQGVFPMDTAFKRRWNFEYLGINENEEEIEGMIRLGDDPEPIEWNTLRKAINDKLSKQYKVNEDKLMGPFFLSKKVLKTDEEGMIEDTEGFIRTFKSKVIMYLYEDAAKQHKYKLFEGCDNSKYSSVCDAFDKIGIRIFGDNFKADYYNNQEG